MIIPKAAVEFLSVVQSYSKNTYPGTGRVTANGS